jgi:CheY-like chemotaxis protein
MLSGDITFFASAGATHDSGGLTMCAAGTRSVLVVDDDKDIRDLLSDALAAEGYVVASARHGAEALERLRAFRPDLILLDLMMPVMDGLAFIAAKKDDPALADIPVIAMTAATWNDVEGAVALLRKPFDLDAFLADVARRLRKRTAG